MVWRARSLLGRNISEAESLDEPDEPNTSQEILALNHPETTVPLGVSYSEWMVVLCLLIAGIGYYVQS